MSARIYEETAATNRSAGSWPDRFVARLKRWISVRISAAAPGHVCPVFAPAGEPRFFGIDLSPEFGRASPPVESRNRVPARQYVCAWTLPKRLGLVLLPSISIIHVPRPDHMVVFSEMRTGASTGVAFSYWHSHVGDEIVHLDNLWGTDRVH